MRDDFLVRRSELLKRICIPAAQSFKVVMKDQSDQLLLKQIEKGDRGAFGELLNRHSLRAYRLALRICGRREDAEDIVQDVMLKLWKEPWRYNQLEAGTFSTWLYRVVSNAALNVVKRRRFEADDDSALADLRDDHDTEEALDNRLKRLRVTAALEKIPDQQKHAVILCYFEEFSIQEAAAIMNLNIPALQSLLMRGKANLKRIFQEPTI